MLYPSSNHFSLKRETTSHIHQICTCIMKDSNKRSKNNNKKKKNQLQPRILSELLKTDRENLGPDKDLGGDSDPPSVGVVCGYTQLFL